MPEKTQVADPELVAKEEVWLWQYVIRCIDHAPGDDRKPSAYKLVNQQMRILVDLGRKP
jgi:hypothetical protein